MPVPQVEPARAPPRQFLLTVWWGAAGDFRARAVLADGSLRDFDSPFELARFLSQPPGPQAGAPPGLR